MVLFLVPLGFCLSCQDIEPANTNTDLNSIDSSPDVGSDRSDSGTHDLIQSGDMNRDLVHTKDTSNDVIYVEDSSEDVQPDIVVEDIPPILRAGSFSLLIYNVAGLPALLSDSNPATNIPIISPLLNAYDLVLVQEDFWYHNQLKAGGNATLPI